MTHWTAAIALTRGRKRIEPNISLRWAQIIYDSLCYQTIPLVGTIHSDIRIVLWLQRGKFKSASDAGLTMSAGQCPREQCSRFDDHQEKPHPEQPQKCQVHSCPAKEIVQLFGLLNWCWRQKEPQVDDSLLMYILSAEIMVDIQCQPMYRENNFKAAFIDYLPFS